MLDIKAEKASLNMLSLRSFGAQLNVADVAFFMGDPVNSLGCYILYSGAGCFKNTYQGYPGQTVGDTEGVCKDLHDPEEV